MKTIAYTIHHKDGKDEQVEGTPVKGTRFALRKDAKGYVVDCTITGHRLGTFTYQKAAKVIAMDAERFYDDPLLPCYIAHMRALDWKEPPSFSEWRVHGETK